MVIVSYDLGSSFCSVNLPYTIGYPQSEQGWAINQTLWHSISYVLIFQMVIQPTPVKLKQNVYSSASSSDNKLTSALNDNSRPVLGTMVDYFVQANLISSKTKLDTVSALVAVNDTIQNNILGNTTVNDTTKSNYINSSTNANEIDKEFKKFSMSSIYKDVGTENTIQTYLTDSVYVINDTLVYTGVTSAMQYLSDELRAPGSGQNAASVSPEKTNYIHISTSASGYHIDNLSDSVSRKFEEIPDTTGTFSDTTYLSVVLDNFLPDSSKLSTLITTDSMLYPQVSTEIHLSSTSKTKPFAELRTPSMSTDGLTVKINTARLTKGKEISSSQNSFSSYDDFETPVLIINKPHSSSHNGNGIHYPPMSESAVQYSDNSILDSVYSAHVSLIYAATPHFTSVSERVHDLEPVTAYFTRTHTAALTTIVSNQRNLDSSYVQPNAGIADNSANHPNAETIAGRLVELSEARPLTSSEKRSPLLDTYWVSSLPLSMVNLFDSLSPESYIFTYPGVSSFELIANVESRSTMIKSPGTVSIGSMIKKSMSVSNESPPTTELYMIMSTSSTKHLEISSSFSISSHGLSATVNQHSEMLHLVSISSPAIPAKVGQQLEITSSFLISSSEISAIINHQLEIIPSLSTLSLALSTTVSQETDITPPLSKSSPEISTAVSQQSEIIPSFSISSSEISDTISHKSEITSLFSISFHKLSATVSQKLHTTLSFSIPSPELSATTGQQIQISPSFSSSLSDISATGNQQSEIISSSDISNTVSYKLEITPSFLISPHELSTTVIPQSDIIPSFSMSSSELSVAVNQKSKITPSFLILSPELSATVSQQSKLLSISFTMSPELSAAAIQHSKIAPSFFISSSELSVTMSKIAQTILISSSEISDTGSHKSKISPPFSILSPELSTTMSPQSEIVSAFAISSAELSATVSQQLHVEPSFSVSSRELSASVSKQSNLPSLAFTLSSELSFTVSQQSEKTSSAEISAKINKKSVIITSSAIPDTASTQSETTPSFSISSPELSATLSQQSNISSSFSISEHELSATVSEQLHTTPSFSKLSPELSATSSQQMEISSSFSISLPNISATENQQSEIRSSFGISNTVNNKSEIILAPEQSATLSQQSNISSSFSISEHELSATVSEQLHTTPSFSKLSPELSATSSQQMEISSSFSISLPNISATENQQSEIRSSFGISNTVNNKSEIILAPEQSATVSQQFHIAPSISVSSRELSATVSKLSNLSSLSFTLSSELSFTVSQQSEITSSSETSAKIKKKSIIITSSKISHSEITQSETTSSYSISSPELSATLSQQSDIPPSLSMSSPRLSASAKHEWEITPLFLTSHELSVFVNQQSKIASSFLILRELSATVSQQSEITQPFSILSPEVSATVNSKPQVPLMFSISSPDLSAAINQQSEIHISSPDVTAKVDQKWGIAPSFSVSSRDLSATVHQQSKTAPSFSILSRELSATASQQLNIAPTFSVPSIELLVIASKQSEITPSFSKSSPDVSATVSQECEITPFFSISSPELRTTVIPQSEIVLSFSIASPELSATMNKQLHIIPSFAISSPEISTTVSPKSEIALPVTTSSPELPITVTQQLHIAQTFLISSSGISTAVIQQFEITPSFSVSSLELSATVSHKSEITPSFSVSQRVLSSTANHQSEISLSFLILSPELSITLSQKSKVAPSFSISSTELALTVSQQSEIIPLFSISADELSTTMNQQLHETPSFSISSPELATTFSQQMAIAPSFSISLSELSVAVNQQSKIRPTILISSFELSVTMSKIAQTILISSSEISDTGSHKSEISPPFLILSPEQSATVSQQLHIAPSFSVSSRELSASVSKQSKLQSLSFTLSSELSFTVSQQSEITSSSEITAEINKKSVIITSSGISDTASTQSETTPSFSISSPELSATLSQQSDISSSFSISEHELSATVSEQLHTTLSFSKLSPELSATSSQQMEISSLSDISAIKNQQSEIRSSFGISNTVNYKSEITPSFLISPHELSTTVSSQSDIVPYFSISSPELSTLVNQNSKITPSFLILSSELSATVSQQSKLLSLSFTLSNQLLFTITQYSEITPSSEISSSEIKPSFSESSLELSATVSKHSKLSSLSFTLSSELSSTVSHQSEIFPLFSMSLSKLPVSLSQESDIYSPSFSTLLTEISTTVSPIAEITPSFSISSIELSATFSHQSETTPPFFISSPELSVTISQQSEIIPLFSISSSSEVSATVSQQSKLLSSFLKSSPEQSEVTQHKLSSIMDEQSVLTSSYILFSPDVSFILTQQSQITPPFILLSQEFSNSVSEHSKITQLFSIWSPALSNTVNQQSKLSSSFFISPPELSAAVSKQSEIRQSFHIMSSVLSSATIHELETEPTFSSSHKSSNIVSHKSKLSLSFQISSSELSSTVGNQLGIKPTPLMSHEASNIVDQQLKLSSSFLIGSPRLPPSSVSQQSDIVSSFSISSPAFSTIMSQESEIFTPSFSVLSPELPSTVSQQSEITQSFFVSSANLSTIVEKLWDATSLMAVESQTTSLFFKSSALLSERNDVKSSVVLPFLQSSNDKQLEQISLFPIFSHRLTSSAFTDIALSIGYSWSKMDDSRDVTNLHPTYFTSVIDSSYSHLDQISITRPSNVATDVHTTESISEAQSSNSYAMMEDSKTMSSALSMSVMTAFILGIATETDSLSNESWNTNIQVSIAKPTLSFSSKVAATDYSKTGSILPLPPLSRITLLNESPEIHDSRYSTWRTDSLSYVDANRMSGYVSSNIIPSFSSEIFNEFYSQSNKKLKLSVMPTTITQMSTPFFTDRDAGALFQTDLDSSKPTLLSFTQGTYNKWSTTHMQDTFSTESLPFHAKYSVAKETVTVLSPSALSRPHITRIITLLEEETMHNRSMSEMATLSIFHSPPVIQSSASTRTRHMLSLASANSYVNTRNVITPPLLIKATDIISSSPLYSENSFSSYEDTMFGNSVLQTSQSDSDAHSVYTVQNLNLSYTLHTNEIFLESVTRNIHITAGHIIRVPSKYLSSVESRKADMSNTLGGETYVVPSSSFMFTKDTIEPTKNTHVNAMQYTKIKTFLESYTSDGGNITLPTKMTSSFAIVSSKPLKTDVFSYFHTVVDKRSSIGTVFSNKVQESSVDKTFSCTQPVPYSETLSEPIELSIIKPDTSTVSKLDPVSLIPSLTMLSSERTDLSFILDSVQDTPTTLFSSDIVPFALKTHTHTPTILYTRTLNSKPMSYLVLQTQWPVENITISTTAPLLMSIRNNVSSNIILHTTTTFTSSLQLAIYSMSSQEASGQTPPDGLKSEYVYPLSLMPNATVSAAANSMVDTRLPSDKGMLFSSEKITLDQVIRSSLTIASSVSLHLSPNVITPSVSSTEALLSGFIVQYHPTSEISSEGEFRSVEKSLYTTLPLTMQQIPTWSMTNIYPGSIDSIVLHTMPLKSSIISPSFSMPELVTPQSLTTLPLAKTKSQLFTLLQSEPLQTTRTAVEKMFSDTAPITVDATESESEPSILISQKNAIQTHSTQSISETFFDTIGIPYVTSTSMLLSTSPTEIIQPSVTLSTVAFTSSVTVATTAPQLEGLLKIGIRVKLNVNITGTQFKEEIETGLFNCYLEGLDKGQDQPNLSRTRRQAGKHDTGAKITSLIRDEENQELVETQFYIQENGKILSADETAALFNRLTVAETSALLHYPVVVPVRAANASPTQINVGSFFGPLTITLIAVPSVIVVLATVIYIAMVCPDHCRPYQDASFGSPTKSLDDFDLMVDIEKGEIVSRSSSRFQSLISYGSTVKKPRLSSFLDEDVSITNLKYVIETTSHDSDAKSDETSPEPLEPMQNTTYINTSDAVRQLDGSMRSDSIIFGNAETCFDKGIQVPNQVNASTDSIPNGGDRLISEPEQTILSATNDVKTLYMPKRQRHERKTYKCNTFSSKIIIEPQKVQIALSPQKRHGRCTRDDHSMNTDAIFFSDNANETIRNTYDVSHINSDNSYYCSESDDIAPIVKHRSGKRAKSKLKYQTKPDSIQSEVEPYRHLPSSPEGPPSVDMKSYRSQKYSGCVSNRSGCAHNKYSPSLVKEVANIPEPSDKALAYSQSKLNMQYISQEQNSVDERTKTNLMPNSFSGGDGLVLDKTSHPTLNTNNSSMFQKMPSTVIGPNIRRIQNTGVVNPCFSQDIPLSKKNGHELLINFSEGLPSIQNVQTTHLTSKITNDVSCSHLNYEQLKHVDKQKTYEERRQFDTKLMLVPAKIGEFLRPRSNYRDHSKKRAGSYKSDEDTSVSVLNNMSKREYQEFYDDEESSHSETSHLESENESSAIIEDAAEMVCISPPQKHPPQYLHYRKVQVQRNRPYAAKMSHSDTGEKQKQKKRKLFYMAPFKQRVSADALPLEDLSSIDRQKNKDRLLEREKINDKTGRDRKRDVLFKGPDFYNQENIEKIDQSRFTGFQNENMWAQRVCSSSNTPMKEMKLGRNMRAAPRRRCEFAEGIRLTHSRDKLETNSASQPLLSIENGRPSDAVTDYYFTTCPIDTGCNKSHDPVLGLTSSARTHVCPQHPTQDLIEMLNRQQQLQVQHKEQQKQLSEQLVLKQQAQQIVNETLLQDELNAKRKKENDTARAKALLSNAFPLADVTKTFFSGNSGSLISGLNSAWANSDLEKPGIEPPAPDGSMSATEIPRLHENPGLGNDTESTEVVGQDKEELMKFVNNELERLKTD